VGPPYQPLAYANRPLPIDERQTISQPYVVALMTQALELKNTDRVLEVGTGSGYQTAILAELAAEVATVEVRENLARAARRKLEGLGYDNICYKIGDGMKGWEEHAPYDAVIVTACGSLLPQTLLDQMRVGGRMVIPLTTDDSQELYLIRKLAGGLAVHPMGRVSFVPIHH
jgi:protein-L-isoaspartate(D-aspartate) O-methyltransferase